MKLRVAIVGAVGKQDLTLADAVQHVDGAPAVMSLSFRQLERDRETAGINAWGDPEP